MQRDGRIVAGTTSGVARFTDTGLDTSFGTGGFARVGDQSMVEPVVNAVGLQADGKILAAGLELYRWTAR